MENKPKYNKTLPSVDTARLNAEIKKEINANKVNIDQGVFKKSHSERLQLASLKKSNQLSVLNGNKDSLLKDFMSKELPNWGGLVFNGKRFSKN
jgi:hypothetical protein